jgi:hypothetical protein
MGLTQLIFYEHPLTISCWMTELYVEMYLY